MTEASLGYINDLLDSSGVAYQFEAWTIDPVPDPYFVGEYTENNSPTLEECGQQDTIFMLTGTGTTWLALEQAKTTIKKIFPRTAILPNNDGIAVFYSRSFPVPTGDAELKRIQIDLLIKEWRVND